MSELASTIGMCARSARVRLGLTQADVAERVGIAMEVYSRMERGHMSPSIRTLRKMCLVLGISADALLGLEVLPASAPLAPPTRAEEPATLRRLLRVLKALDVAQLQAVSKVLHGALGLMAKKPRTRKSRRKASDYPSAGQDLARLEDALYSHDAGPLAAPLE